MNTTMNLNKKLPAFPSHITITTYNDWPYSKYIYENGTVTGHGFAFELLQLLVRRFNFTYTIVPPAKNSIGDEKSGMIKQLYNKEVDMAVAFIPIISEFRNYCDFSVTLDEMDTTFLMKRPGTSSSGSGLLAPFSDKVWIMIFISLMIVGPTIYLMIFLRSKFSKDECTEKYTLLTCIWFVYGALLKQGTTVSPIGDSTRLVFATWWIFITILTSFYTANLTAFLTLSKFTLAINTLDDLVNYRYSWFIISGRSIHTLLQQNSAETYVLAKSRNWGYGYLSSDYNMTYKNMLKYTGEGRVFITDRFLAQMAILEDYKNKTSEGMNEEKRCTYVISEKNVLPKRRGFAFPKGSLIQKYIDDELMAAVEGGLVEHFKLKDLPEAQICPLNLKSKERRLKVSDLWMTYKVVFGGMGVAVIIFILELLSRVARKYADYSCFRKNKLTSEIKSTEAPDDPWDYSKKDNSNFWIRTPPPVYQLNEEASQKTYSINGRDYYIVKEETGDRRLIPIRAPSAYLFQYIH